MFSQSATDANKFSESPQIHPVTAPDSEGVKQPPVPEPPYRPYAGEPGESEVPYEPYKGM
jgi:hypothetical protein